MRAKLHPNTVLGGLSIGFALVLIFLWVPWDSETGLAIKKRGKYIIGDALAPTVAGLFFLIPGVMLVLGRKAPDAPRLARADLRFIGWVIGIVAVGIVIMRWAGPLVGALTEGGYRPLRATAPWKYIGFALGGAGIVTGLIALVEGRLTRRAVLIGLGAVTALILLYDLPFEDLLLPPNGDV